MTIGMEERNWLTWMHCQTFFIFKASLTDFIYEWAAGGFLCEGKNIRLCWNFGIFHICLVVFYNAKYAETNDHIRISTVSWMNNRQRSCRFLIRSQYYQDITQLWIRTEIWLDVVDRLTVLLSLNYEKICSTSSLPLSTVLNFWTILKDFFSYFSLNFTMPFHGRAEKASFHFYFLPAKLKLKYKLQVHISHSHLTGLDKMYSLPKYRTVLFHWSNIRMMIKWRLLF